MQWKICFLNIFFFFSYFLSFFFRVRKRFFLFCFFSVSWPKSWKWNNSFWLIIRWLNCKIEISLKMSRKKKDRISVFIRKLHSAFKNWGKVRIKYNKFKLNHLKQFFHYSDNFLINSAQSLTNDQRKSKFREKELIFLDRNRIKSSPILRKTSLVRLRFWN